jgi:hypothetical protein
MIMVVPALMSFELLRQKAVSGQEGAGRNPQIRMFVMSSNR